MGRVFHGLQHPDRVHAFRDRFSGGIDVGILDLRLINERDDCRMRLKSGGAGFQSLNSGVSKEEFIMQTFIVLIIVGVCCLYIGRRFYKSLKSESPACGCGDGCAGCSMHASGCEIPQYTEKKDL
ncbi:MAG: hypothetical protein DSY89_04620 [Deltaproteobacteria bacterium]|nr:MAG: hypothetical protein DSY89_04620 [Deltaproteobacteria bacterium]